MRKSKSNMLRRVILVITAFVMTVGLTACKSSSNTEFSAKSSNSYKVNVEKQTEDFYVNDFANLLSEADKKVMIANAVELAEEYDGIQVVVTTVNNLNGNEIEEYAYSMYGQYGIGKDSMGILILLSVGDRDVKIETGKTMQAYITDSKSGQLLDKYGMDYFREDKFAEGLKSVQEAVISEIKKVVPIDWNGREETTVNESNSTTAVVSSKEDAENSKDQSKDAVQNNNGMGVIDMVFAVLFIMALAIIGVLIIAYRKMKTSFSDATEMNTQLSKQVKGLKADVSEATNQNEQLSRTVKELNEELEQTCSNHEKTTQSMKQQYEQTYSELKGRISDITQKNTVLNAQIAETEEFYGRVRKLHPECNFEKEVEAMIESEFRAAVSSVDEQINTAINMTADKDRVDTFKNVINIYETAESDIREAVTADIGKVRDLYQESVKLRNIAEAKATAEKVDEKLNSVLDMKADKYNVEMFENALKAYNAESALTKKFVKADIDKVRCLHEESERLRKTFEKEQQEARDKAESQKVCNEMKKVLHGNSNGEYYEYDNLREAYLLYEDLTHAQKEFFPDMEMLRRYKSIMLKAEKAKQDHDVACKAEENAQSAIRFIYGTADENDRNKISKAFGYYNDLSLTQKPYFSSELLHKMHKLKREADEDHENMERRRREEREQSSYSSSLYSSLSSHHSSTNFGGDSHYSGLGGNPSGGGASRHF